MLGPLVVCLTAALLKLGKSDPLPSRCAGRSVCLLDGDRGEIFVRHKDSHRPICDDGWDRTDANVACKEAGYPRGALMATTSGSSRGSSYAMDGVSCAGSESKLVNCRHSQRHDCGPLEAAGAVGVIALSRDEGMPTFLSPARRLFK